MIPFFAKPRQWAKMQGIQYRTAWLRFKKGKLPVKAYQTATGTIIVMPDETTSESVGGFCRRLRPGIVSRSENRSFGTVWQAGCVGRTKRICDQKSSYENWLVNPHNRQLMALLADPRVRTVIVQHRDRSDAIFGSEYFEAALSAQNRNPVMVNPDELKGNPYRI